MDDIRLFQERHTSLTNRRLLHKVNSNSSKKQWSKWHKYSHASTVYQCFSTCGPRTPGGPRRVSGGSASDHQIVNNLKYKNKSWNLSDSMKQVLQLSLPPPPFITCFWLKTIQSTLKLFVLLLHKLKYCQRAHKKC